MPRSVVQEARRLAAGVTFAGGRCDAIVRHLLALAVCQSGWMSLVARVPLFHAPGLLLADPHREAFYWSLDPGVPGPFEASAVARLASLLRARPRPEPRLRRLRRAGGDGEPDVALVQA